MLAFKQILRVENISTYYGEVCIHKNISFAVNQGEIVAIVGGSGSGKTTLLHELIMLRVPDEGNVYLFGKNTHSLSTNEMDQYRIRFGVLFQNGALFSALTVKENIAVPLKEHTQFSDDLIDEICYLKLALVGLDAEVGMRYPRQLSGGMVKRVALARALALDPNLLFLDEPSAGLDPISAHSFDRLILQLRESLDLTVVMITHDMDTLWQVSDRVAFLGEKRLLSYCTMEELLDNPHPLISAFVKGPRGRNARINQ